MTPLQTERLLLRRPTLTDFDSYAAMWADPDVMEYLSQSGQPMARHEAWRAFTGQAGHWSLRGFGMFAVIERVSADLVGIVGPWLPEGWPDCEIGWTLRSAWWKRGYATEAANACLRYAFMELGRAHIVSFITPENAPSIRLAERLGEQLEGEVTLPHLPPERKVLQYGLSREAWQRRG
jgi:RimJ/RimL family protein N-acetyltransferase